MVYTVTWRENIVDIQNSARFNDDYNSLTDNNFGLNILGGQSKEKKERESTTKKLPGLKAARWF